MTFNNSRLSTTPERNTALPLYFKPTFLPIGINGEMFTVERHKSSNGLGCLAFLCSKKAAHKHMKKSAALLGF